MKKEIITLILVFFIIGCTVKTSNDKNQGSAQLANPASVYCIEQEGTLSLETEEAGQYGICNLPNGTKCEEWAYFRGECP